MMEGMTPTNPASPSPAQRAPFEIETLTADGATETTVERVAGVLAEAFATDPFTTKLLPGHEDGHVDRLRVKFVRMITDMLAVDADGLPRGAVDVAVDPADGSVLGVALWERPGHADPTWRDQLSRVPNYLRTHGAKAWDALRTTAACDRARPSQEHWYLTELGTTPAARGRGVGSGLVRHRIAHAQEQGVGVYLESSTRDNVPFYAKLGFEEVETIQTKGTNDLTAMWQKG
jgi:GNAT superfamily N-acetyltransferase